MAKLFGAEENWLLSFIRCANQHCCLPADFFDLGYEPSPAGTCPLAGNSQSKRIAPLPAAIANLPLVGANIFSFWTDLWQSPKEVIDSHEHELNMILRHIITGGLGVLGVAVQFIIGIIISAFFLERGDRLLLPVRNKVKHLLSHHDGEGLLEAISQAIKGVSIG